MKGAQIILLTIFFYFPASIYAQSPALSDSFTITGNLTGVKNSVFVLNYRNALNKWQADTALISNSHFTFTGSINTACEALLWTDTSQHAFDNPYMIRLLLQPGDIQITGAWNDLKNASVTGAPAHAEKKLWEDKNAALLSQKETIRSGNGGQRKYDSILTAIRNIDLYYVRQHPHSFVSGLLLSKHKRRMPVDSVEIYFDGLHGNVQNSSIGYEVLSHIYPLSNNAAFKNKYPVFGNDFNAALSAVKSIHDISLPDPSGKMISFGKFKGNYILLDFWASWCGPCISDMPYFEKIIKAYKKYPIKFVSVSLDKDAAEWKKAIKKYKPASLQLGDMKAFSGLLPVYCKLPVGVPTYMLVDKNGKIINYQLPRPQEIELRQLLDKILLEK